MRTGYGNDGKGMKDWYLVIDNRIQKAMNMHLFSKKELVNTHKIC